MPLQFNYKVKLKELALAGKKLLEEEPESLYLLAKVDMKRMQLDYYAILNAKMDILE